MRNRELSRQIQQLNALITRTDQASAGDVEMQSHWAKYICVLSAGLLENTLPELYAEYAQGSASPAIALYVRTSVSKIQNPKTARFIETAGAFKKEWEEELRAFADDEGRKDAVDSIMSNRHRIAHGKYRTSLWRGLRITCRRALNSLSLSKSNAQDKAASY